MVMKYSISNLGSNDPKKRKPFNTTSQQLAQQVAGQQLTVANKPGQLPGAGGQPQLTSPLDTQTGRQTRGMPGEDGYGGGGGGTFKQPDLPGVIGGRPDKPTLRPGGKTGNTMDELSGTNKLETSVVKPELAAEKEKQRKIKDALERAKAKGRELALANKEAGVDMFGESTLTDEEAINKAISDLLREQTDVTAEREAMLGEMRAQEAQAIQGLRARAGLGGMGLTGATAGLEAQARTQAGRAEALTTAQFDRAARDEALRRLIQGIELKRGEQVFGAGMELYEPEADRDFNGDGFINGQKVGENGVGDGNPSNNTGAAGAGGVSGAGGPGAGTSPPNVDAEGNPVKPEGGYSSTNPPSNAKIPDKKAQAWSQGYNNDPATVAYYESLPVSGFGKFPLDDHVDNFMMGDTLYGVAINANGQYYIFEYTGVGSDNPNPYDPMFQPR